MACQISQGRTIACKTVGGLKAIYFINNDSDFYGDLEFDGLELVSGFSENDYQLYKYELRGANTMDETNEVSEDNGTAFWSLSGAFQLQAQDGITRKELKLLAYGRPHIITEGWDGTFKIYGAEFGCTVSVNTASGAGMGDFNGYSLTVTGMQTEPAFIVKTPSIIGDGTESTVIS